MKWNCRCSASQQRGCIHRAVAEWLCHQEHSHLMWSTDDSDSEDVPEQEAAEEAKEDCRVSLSYPPKGDLLIKTLDYLKQYKTIPLDLESHLVSGTSKVMQFTPSEVMCKYCNGVQLQGPFLITTKGKVIGLDQVVESKAASYCWVHCC